MILKADRNNIKLLLIFFVIFASISICFAPQTKAQQAHADSLINAAKEIMSLQKYCALITIDSLGLPNVRTMNPFPPEEDMTVWVATTSRSRKVENIKHNSNVCLYYANHASAVGYVSITGKAYLVDDMQEKLKRKREYWTQAFPDWKYLILIKIIPEKIEVLNYKRGFNGESQTWKVPNITFQRN